MTPPEPEPPAVYPPPPQGVGRAQLGRHREHVFPGRQHRVSPSFTAEEHAVIVAAAVRAGLTPSGFCARAALGLAAGSGGDGAGRLDSDRFGSAVTPGPGDERVEAWAAVQAELADTRLTVTRVGTNLNQAMAAFHTTGQPPVWLARVVETCGRALAAVDEAASALHRRLR